MTMSEVEDLLREFVHEHIKAFDGEVAATVAAALSDHPEWLKALRQNASAHAPEHAARKIAAEIAAFVRKEDEHDAQPVLPGFPARSLWVEISEARWLPFQDASEYQQAVHARLQKERSSRRARYFDVKAQKHEAHARILDEQIPNGGHLPYRQVKLVFESMEDVVAAQV